jgi:hypothetical protein
LLRWRWSRFLWLVFSLSSPCLPLFGMCSFAAFDGIGPRQIAPNLTPAILRVRSGRSARGLSLSKIKSGHSDGAIRRELGSRVWVQRPELPVKSAYLCSGKGVFSRHYNMPSTKGGCGAGAIRQGRHGQRIPAGSSQSAVPHAHSAMASVARLAGREYPWREAAG